MWWHLCTGTVLNGLPLFCKIMVLWNTRAGATVTLLVSLYSQEPASPFHRAAFKDEGWASSLTMVSALSGSFPASRATVMSKGKCESLCLLFESQEKPGTLSANWPLWFQCLPSLSTLPTAYSPSTDTA